LKKVQASSEYSVPLQMDYFHTLNEDDFLNEGDIKLDAFFNQLKSTNKKNTYKTPHQSTLISNMNDYEKLEIKDLLTAKQYFSKQVGFEDNPETIIELSRSKFSKYDKFRSDNQFEILKFQDSSIHLDWQGVYTYSFKPEYTFKRWYKGSKGFMKFIDIEHNWSLPNPETYVISIDSSKVIRVYNHDTFKFNIVQRGGSDNLYIIHTGLIDKNFKIPLHTYSFASGGYYNDVEGLIITCKSYSIDEKGFINFLDGYHLAQLKNINPSDHNYKDLLNIRYPQQPLDSIVHYLKKGNTAVISL
jgi:hypothetical protein